MGAVLTLFSHAVNWRRGGFRLWLLATVAWGAYVAHAADYDIRYAIDYLGNYSSLASPSKAAEACTEPSRFSAADEEPTIPPLDTLGLTGDRGRDEAFEVLNEVARDAHRKAQQRHRMWEQRKAAKAEVFAKCVREFHPSPPQFWWIAMMVLPPTVGLLLVFLAWRVLYGIGLWVWKGFFE